MIRVFCGSGAAAAVLGIGRFGGSDVASYLSPTASSIPSCWYRSPRFSPWYFEDVRLDDGIGRA